MFEMKCSIKGEFTFLRKGHIVNCHDEINIKTACKETRLCQMANDVRKVRDKVDRSIIIYKRTVPFVALLFQSLVSATGTRLIAVFINTLFHDNFPKLLTLYIAMKQGAITIFLQE